MDLPSTQFSLLAALNQDAQASTAWNAFDARYRPVILVWCRRRGLDQEAEDLTQQILIKLLHVLPRHVHDPAQGQFRGWLKTVVENTLRDHWRKRERNPQPEGVGGSAFLGELGNLADLNEKVEELSTAIQAQAEGDAEKIVHRARSRFDEKTWQAFIRTQCEKRPTPEVARELGLSTSTVYTYSYRVKQALLEEMQKRWD